MLPSGFGVRTECGVINGSAVTWYYDPLLLKVIVKAQNRANSINKMKAALNEVVINGVLTNLEVHKETLSDTGFLEGNYNIYDFDGKY